MKNFFALLRMTLVRKLTPLKVIGFAFRKDKGTFISGSKENNSCAGSREGDGRGMGGNTFAHRHPDIIVSLIIATVLLIIKLFSFNLV